MPKRTRRPKVRPNPITRKREQQEMDTHRRKAAKRVHENALRASRARDLLQELPAEGVSLHGIQRGNFNFFDIVPAILDLAKPAVCELLVIATLGFNRANVEQLLELIDDGRIQRAELVASVFYRAHNPAVCKWTTEQLEQRGGAFHACRNHAKVIGLQLSDGRAFTLEGSANLRSCRMVEQFCLTHDAELLDFHRSWIAELVRSEQEAS